MRKEEQKIQNLAFLKQLESDGNSQVYWEKETYRLMNQIEQQKKTFKETDYEKKIKIKTKKQRPRDIIYKEIEQQSNYISENENKKKQQEKGEITIKNEEDIQDTIHKKLFQSYNLQPVLEGETKAHYYKSPHIR